MKEKENHMIYVNGNESNFANNLETLRLSYEPRLSQETIAHKLGTCRKTYAQYENGERMPPGWFIFNVSKYFGVTMEVLMSSEPIKEKEEKQ